MHMQKLFVVDEIILIIIAILNTASSSIISSKYARENTIQEIARNRLTVTSNSSIKLIPSHQLIPQSKADHCGKWTDKNYINLTKQFFAFLHLQFRKTNPLFQLPLFYFLMQTIKPFPLA